MANTYEIYSELLFAKAGSKGIPLSGTFELTSRCNLDCRMCYIHKRANDASARRKEKTADQWLSLARECRDAGMLLLLLTGGEPFLRPDFREIYAGCRKLGLLVSINTNGTLITPEMMDFLEKDPPARMNITLYGASPETYGALCGNPSAFEKAKNTILELKKRGIFVKLNFSMTQYNCGDLEAVFEFAKENLLPIQVATYMFPPSRACEQGNCQAERMTPLQSAEGQMRYDCLRYTKEELKEKLTAALNGASYGKPTQECQELPSEHMNCRAGVSTFWVTWDGQLRICGMMDGPGVRLLPGKFPDAWKEVQKYRKEILVPAKCTACSMREFCDPCAAVCRGETGSFTGTPEYMCQRTQEYLKMAEKVLEELE